MIDMNWSLIGAQRSDQANTHPLKKRVLLGSAKDLWDPQTPISNRPIRALTAVHLSWQAGHAVTGSPHPRCKPQPTGAQESPRRASEPPRRKESQSPKLNSVSTDNPKARAHPSSPQKPPPYPYRPEGTPRGGFRHVQHVRPNRGPHKNGTPHEDQKKILQRANTPKLPESH